MIRLVDPSFCKSPYLMAARIREQTKFDELFPNMPLRLIRTTNGSPELWGMIVIMNETTIFSVNRLFNQDTFDLELVFRFSADMECFLGLDIGKKFEYPDADQVAAFNTFLEKINTEFDAFVEKVNDCIRETGPSWVYDSMLKKVWKFRLGLGGGDAYFSPT